MTTQNTPKTLREEVLQLLSDLDDYCYRCCSDGYILLQEDDYVGFISSPCPDCSLKAAELASPPDSLAVNSQGATYPLDEPLSSRTPPNYQPPLSRD